MTDVAFWELGSRSDAELLQGLDGVIRTGRRALALLIAHLAEAEERRLHLRAACPSMFSYCVTRLGFSEDEACRRIDVARLARRHPALFAALASGEVSLSVAALLKPHLAADNAAKLLAAVAGKTVQQAREVLAAHFPQPDVPSLLRKLPERSTASAPAANIAPAPPVAAPAAAVSSASPAQPLSSPIPARRSQSNWPQRIAPLAPARYKLELTADAELKAKLELARDLMRHANPSGDFAPILKRALDLLISEIEKRRFGACSKPAHAAAAKRTATAKAPSAPVVSSDAPNPNPSRHISRSTRRRLVERDGLRCCWTDESGRRCGSRAWLEHDHEVPHAHGGSADEANLRLFCSAHNRLEAERRFGRQHVDTAIAHARRRRAKAAAAKTTGASTDPASERTGKHSDPGRGPPLGR